RHGANRDAGRRAGIDDAPHVTARRGGNGDDDLVDALAADDLGHLAEAPRDRNPVDAVALLAAVVVGERDRLIPIAVNTLHLSQEVLTRVARPHDEQP